MQDIRQVPPSGEPPRRPPDRRAPRGARGEPDHDRADVGRTERQRPVAEDLEASGGIDVRV